MTLVPRIATLLLSLSLASCLHGEHPFIHFFRPPNYICFKPPFLLAHKKVVPRPEKEEESYSAFAVGVDTSLDQGNPKIYGGKSPTLFLANQAMACARKLGRK